MDTERIDHKMKKKAFLPLLEQIIMIGFFAAVATICLQGIALANRISNEQAITDRAVLAAQNIAETLKSTQGDTVSAADVLSGSAENGSLIVFYDVFGNPVSNEDSRGFKGIAEITEGSNPLLGSASVQIIYKDEVIYSLTVGWQKDLYNENH
jgi:hypothetical protein